MTPRKHGSIRPTRPQRVSQFELLESRAMLARDVIISEFMALNDGGAGALLDEDGAASDWIELENVSTAPVNIGGWYLTDDAAVPNRWQLPPRTLAANERLVVFASAKNRTGPQWHTNFQLQESGEYLGLIRSDGVSVASEFAPSFPNQVSNISYGRRLQLRTDHSLVVEASEVQLLSPADGSLGATWTSAEFDDSLWPSDPHGAQGTQPVGFDADYVPAAPGPYIASVVRGGTSVNPAPQIVAAGLAEDVPSYNDRTHQYNGVTTTSTISSLGLQGADFIRPSINDRAAADFSLTLNFNGTVDLYLFIDDRVGDNNIANGPTLGATTMPWVASLGFVDTGLNIGIDDNGDGIGPGQSIQSFASIYKKSGVAGSIVLGAQNDTSAGGPSGRNMYGVAAFRSSIGPTIFTDRIQTNVQSKMYATNASAYLRTSFGFAGGGDVELLKLKVKYDDGFVAYLNETEVARRNAPGGAGEPLAFDAAAMGSRPDSSAIVFEEIDITSFSNLLLTGGSNALAFQALNEAVGDADFFFSAELLATTVTQIDELEYFTTPTPGAANVPGVAGLVADTKFNGELGVFHDAGFYSAPFDVTLSTLTPGAQIRYTTNGSPPTATTGTVYSSPIRIAGTTTLRAAAFKPGYQATNVDTQTYIFLAQVLQQTGAGLPPYAAWGHAGADWAIDPDIVNHADPASRVTTNDFLSVPTVSLTMNWNDMFGSGGQGIYIAGSGVERAASVELLNPDGTPGFSVNGSVEIQGGTSDDRWKDDKLSMQLKFHRPYGPTKLNYDLFGGDATNSFDTLILDGVLNWSWVHSTDAAQRANAKYIQDQFVADLQNASGGFAPHGRYVHLYINGLYWGMYYLHERPDKSFNSDYQGGDKDSWNVIKHNSGTIVDSALTNPAGVTASSDFNALLALAAADLSVAANYNAVAAKLDVDQFIDYLIVNWYVGNDDWPAKNWYASSQAAPGGQWRFHSWDAEHTLKDVIVSRVGQSPHGLHTRLAFNAEYRQRFGDHVQELMFHGGLLTPASAAAKYQARMAEVDSAIRGESARWGDNSESIPRTRANWLTTQNNLLSNYFPHRTNILISQLRSAGLFPAINAPVYSQQGGSVSAGYLLSITDPNATPGTIYYALHGNDPRTAGTAYQGPIAIEQSGVIKASILRGGQWSAVNETFFTLQNSLRVSEIMYHPPARTAAEISAGFLDDDDFEFVEILNTSASVTVDLTGVKFVDGIQYTFAGGSLAPAARAVLVRNAAAFHFRYGALLPVAGQYGGTIDNIKLSNNGELITLTDLGGGVIQSFSYLDSWYPATDGLGPSLVSVDPSANLDTWSTSAGWRGSYQAAGSPTTDDLPGSLVDRRLFYNNSAFDGTTPAASAADDNAIASDKSALLPGGVASLENYTSYSRGMNGLMVDLASYLAPITAADFVFRVGNNDTPSEWALAPAPLSVSTRASAGSSGSNRVSIIWPDGSLKNTWLQVTVLANSNTGLAAPDVFYFGNAVGDTGNSPANTQVDATDEVAVRNHPRTFLAPAPVGFLYDFNRDGFVNATDQIIARSHSTTLATALKLIGTPSGLRVSAVVGSEAVSHFADTIGLTAPVNQADRLWAIRLTESNLQLLATASAGIPVEHVQTPKMLDTRGARRVAWHDPDSDSDEYLYDQIATDLVDSRW